MAVTVVCSYYACNSYRNNSLDVIIGEKQIDLEYKMEFNYAEQLHLDHIPLLTTITEDMKKIIKKKCG